MAPDPEALAALREAWSKLQSMPDEPAKDPSGARAISKDPGSGSGPVCGFDAMSESGSDTDPRVAAREIALRRLSVRARSRKELAQDLKSRDVSAEVSEELLNRFAEVGLIDDAAFAEEWVESRGRRSGVARLRQELRLKGVADEHIAEAIGGREDEDLSNARELAARKVASMEGLETIVRQRRLTAYLGRRGFSNAVVRRVVGEVLDAHAAEIDD